MHACAAGVRSNLRRSDLYLVRFAETNLISNSVEVSKMQSGRVLITSN